MVSPVLVETLLMGLSAIAVLEVTVMLVSVPVNVVIIVLSFWKVPNSLARLYVLHVSVVMLASVLFSYVYTEATGTDHEYDDTQLTSSSFALKFIRDFLRFLSLNVYYFQATLTVSLLYAAFTRPVLSRSFITEKNIRVAVVLCHIIATITSAAQVLSLREMPQHSRTSIVGTCSGIVQLISIGIMATCYIRALYHIFVIMKREDPAGGNQSTAKQLRSMLIYCTPPNILLIISVPEILCISFVDSDNPVFGDVCLFFRFTANISQNLRIFITSVCALIAFRDYRHAFASLFKRCWKCCRRKTTVKVVHVSPASTNL
ncbi:hypothetical protein QR680_006201 [Steinernema hermaphroditum]|uniref:Uncharacterized protein n=1 Tax=Steinernema hermaphroditum TaxID=289476 RepID=A0AA39HW17_9BILA|nr:hypothetical protein QR680_006201 [Steinernema hermaphroditum]